MRTKRAVDGGRGRYWAVWALVIGVAPLAAQDPLTAVNPGTEVRKIGFRFEGERTEERTLELSDLKAQLSTTPRGKFHKLFKALFTGPLIIAIWKRSLGKKGRAISSRR